MTYLHPSLRRPITPGKPPSRKAPLARSMKRIRRVSKAKRAATAIWKAVTRIAIELSNGFCLVDLPNCEMYATEGHHKLGQAQGGPDILANCLACCRHCHNELPRRREWAIAKGFIIERRSESGRAMLALAKEVA